MGKAVVEDRPLVAPVQGIFYARSCETAEPFVRLLIKNKEIRPPSLGIQGQTVESSLSDPFVIMQVVCILRFEPDSPAEAAKLQVMDAIFRLNDHVIRNEGDLNNALTFLHQDHQVFPNSSPVLVTSGGLCPVG